MITDPSFLDLACTGTKCIHSDCSLGHAVRRQISKKRERMIDWHHPDRNWKDGKQDEKHKKQVAHLGHFSGISAFKAFSLCLHLLQDLLSGILTSFLVAVRLRSGRTSEKRSRYRIMCSFSRGGRFGVKRRRWRENELCCGFTVRRQGAKSINKPGNERIRKMKRRKERRE